MEFNLASIYSLASNKASLPVWLICSETLSNKTNRTLKDIFKKYPTEDERKRANLERKQEGVPESVFQL